MIKAPPTPKGQKKKIAIFIDAANFEISLKSSGQKADYRKLLVWTKKQGNPVMIHYYSPSFGTDGQNRFFSFIKNLGFKIVTKSLKKIRSSGNKTQNKANFDVEIAFDAAVRIGQFDKFVLFSGDSDFVYLVSELQKRSVHVMVISPQWRTAKELRKQADKFIDLRDCEFVIKKPPFGGAHNNLSTARSNILKIRRKVK